MHVKGVLLVSGEVPKVLLLGDSIRLSYQPKVADLLTDRAQVVGPEENCRFSLYTSTRLPIWLEHLGTPKVVHWNNGLWDCGHCPGRGPVQFTIADYIRNLNSILDQLRQTGAHIIWATITPVPSDRPLANETWYWHANDIEAYNTAANAFMKEQDIPINDLYTLVKSNLQANLNEDQLHLSEAGQQCCGQAVATCIFRELETLP